MIAINPAKPKGIVWLASYPKSGNTWLRVFLYQLARVRRGLPREEDEINKIGVVTRTEAGFYLIYEQFLGKPLAEATHDETITVRTKVQAAIAQHFPGPVFLKTHSLLGTLGARATINTNVSIGAVYLVRDPRDVAVSLAQHVGKSIDEAVELLNELNAFAPGDDRAVGEPWGNWSQNVESWVEGANDTLLAVRYEDMLEKPKETFARIVAHIRQKATSDELDEAIRRSSFDELKQQEKKHGFHLSKAEGGEFFANGKSGGWRDKLTAEQVDAIVAAHGETMRKFGYLD
jgi:hypothetical protein